MEYYTLGKNGKRSFCTLEEFEKMVLEKDENNEDYYIKSPNYYSIAKSDIFLNRI